MSNSLLESLWARVDANIGSRIAQISGMLTQARDAADRIGTAETVEGWANSAQDSASTAAQSASTAAQSESKAKEYRDDAAAAASSAADNVRVELGDIVSDAADYATESSSSASRAKTSEENAATYEANSLSAASRAEASEENAATHEGNSLFAAERAEFAANETIQQVEGDFATRNYADSIKWAHGQVPANTNLDEFITEGTYYAGSTVSATLLNRPPGGEHPGDLVVKRAGVYVYQYWTTYRGGDIESQTFYRWSLNTGTAWAAWRKRVTEADIRRQNPTRPAVLKQRSRIRRGGMIGTNGATPVALTFDHGFGNFRDKVLPILSRLGLPATVAFNDGQMNIAENGGATWSDLQTWGINHGIEYAHHAQSHSDVAIDNLESALTSSISAAATNLPALATDAFIMPGVSGTKWQGFNGGNAASSWWEHPAGQIIATHFPVVSGTTAGLYVPMMGGEDNTWTMYRYSFDNDTRANYFRSKIQNLAGTGMGIAGFMHPSVLDNGSGGTSLAKLTEILEFLAAERDAGRVEVLTLSGFAYADTSTSRRLDLGTTWDSNNNCVIDVGENMAWLKGAQVLISTTPALGGDASIAVTDNTGRSSSTTYSATAGVPIYRAITIPTDATQVTVTCHGNYRSIRVV